MTAITLLTGSCLVLGALPAAGSKAGEAAAARACSAASRGDAASAARWHREAAVQGYAASQVALAIMLKDGTGVPQDVQEAVRWFEQAAAAGETLAMVCLGKIYQEGSAGVPQPSEAVRWYEMAAEHGDPAGWMSLAFLFQYGAYGVEKDLIRAYVWSYSSARFNYSESGAAVSSSALRTIAADLSPEELERATKLAEETWARMAAIRSRELPRP